MKNILFILLILPSFCFGQTLALDYTASTGTIDSYTFPKNTLSYGLTSATNIRIFVDGIGAVWGSRPYTDFTYNGGSFPSLDSLSSWLNANMFGDTSSNQLTLGETSTTAYRGDRGKTAYDHSQLTSGTNPHNTTFANIASKPTTVSGYGITDAIVQGGQSLGVSMSIGTNDNQTLTFRANGATRASVTGAGNFIATGSIYSTNNFISNTNSITPTHSITIPSVGTGIAFYNTVDQTANYERLAITKAANVFSISTAAGGTGVVRDISINGSIFNTSGITSPKFSVSALNTAPSSASDTGTAGEIRITAGFIYVCTATNTWVRVALATW